MNRTVDGEHTALACGVGRLRAWMRGFTLIELLVVIAIISLLGTLVIPSLKQAKGLARTSICGSNLRMVGIAGSILEDQKPEAAYFLADQGNRSAYLIVNLDDGSQLPAIAEPWFLKLHATVEFFPVMLPEDLQKAGPAIEQAVEKYG